MKQFLLFYFFSWWLIGCQSSTKHEPDAVEQADDSSARELLIDSLTIESTLIQLPTPVRFADQVRLFYSLRNYAAAWLDSKGLNSHGLAFVDVLANAQSEGVLLKHENPTFTYERLDSLPAYSAVPGHQARLRTLDVELTAAYYQYVSAKFRGLPPEQRRELEWYIPTGRRSVDEVIDSLCLRTAKQCAEEEPLHPLYNRLKLALRRLVELEQKNQWDSLRILNGSTDRNGFMERMRLVSHRLFIVGDLKDTLDCDSAAFIRAIEHFQHRHGLSVTSILDRPTLAALNVPLHNRIRQILVNMERCRWLPQEPNEDYLVVNIPAYELIAYHNRNVDWRSRVVVGKSTSRTVVFSGKINALVLHPYWVVPNSIARDEVIPAIQNDPAYLERNHMEVVTRGKNPTVVSPLSIGWQKVNPANFQYEIRQTPGPWNALGSVKFLVPNPYSIYLHDTPARQLFEEPKRTFSHGCIRVEKAEELSEILTARNTSWSAARILRAKKSGKETTVPLLRAVPVFVVYFTAWVDAEGEVNFRDDIYGHDQRLAALLFVD